MSILIPYLILFLGSFALCCGLVAVVRGLALKSGFVARPCAGRYHQNIIPLGGGIAVFATLASMLIAAVVIIKFIPINGLADWPKQAIPQLLIVLLCLSILFITGLIDDKKHLSPLFKLLAQFAAAFIAAGLADIRVEFFIQSRVITTLLSALWIVLIINCFNFLDNMDGASAGIAVIAAGCLLTAAAISGQVFVVGFAVVFIGTLLGFLIFNFPPAKIFMGDAGSLLVGFCVALLTLRTTYFHQENPSRWYLVFMPLLVMAVPLYDFISVCFLRISQGKSPLVGDTQHFSHRLKLHGLSDTQAVLVLYLATLATGIGSVFLYQANLFGAVLIFAQCFMVLALIAVFESTVKNGKSIK